MFNYYVLHFLFIQFLIILQKIKVYATSKEYSWTNAKQFRRFCEASNIKCEDINPLKFFKDKMCDGVFDTKEYTFDAMLIKDYFIEELKKYDNVEILYSTRIKGIDKSEDKHIFY